MLTILIRMGNTSRSCGMFKPELQDKWPKILSYLLKTLFISELHNDNIFYNILDKILIIWVKSALKNNYFEKKIQIYHNIFYFIIKFQNNIMNLFFVLSIY